MIDTDALSREELWSLACDWRRRALHGDRTAHGPAHVYEAAYRQRFGERTSAGVLKDLRPLAVLADKGRWRSR